MSVGQPPQEQAGPRFPLLDSLRGLAALAVITVHLPFVAQMAGSNPIRPYLLQLTVGLPVFFVISGFLLYRPFVGARFAGRPQPNTRDYGLRRVLRIVPAYWVALPLVVLLIGPTGEALTARPVFTARGVVEYFGFLQDYDSSTLFGGISAAWSLGVEVAFYVMLPLWARLLRLVPVRSSRSIVRSELLGLSALVAVGVIWTGIGGAHADPTNAVFVDVTKLKTYLFVLPSFLDQLALGMGLAVLSVAYKERASWPAFVRRIDRSPWIAWLVAAAAFVVVAQTPRWFAGDYGVRFLLGHELQALIALALVVPVVFGDQKRGRGRRALNNPVVIWIGVISYSFYLWHAAIILKLARLDTQKALGPVGFSLTALGLTLLVGGASFYAIERPALRLARRLTPRRDSQNADVRAADILRA